MKYHSILSLTLCLVLYTACQNPKGEDGVSAITDEDTRILTHLKEVEWPQSYREQDTLLLDAILAEEFQMIDDAGNWYDKADELAYIKKHAPAYDSFRYEIRRLEIFENGTAIIAGTGHIKGVGEDGPYYSQYQSSNILLKREGVWRAISSHVSGIKRELENK